MKTWSNGSQETLAALARLFVVAALCGLGPCLLAGSASTIPLDRLTIEGRHFKASDGTVVRFWGVNLAALYPTHVQAERLAADLADREINLVRPHHNLRNSPGWNPASGIPALVTYAGDTRTPHAEAWDRFDYFNAQLRDRGIYLLLSLHSTRRFLAGDVDILKTDDSDRANWRDAMTALARLPGNLELFKMLPMLDERCALLMEEFTRQLLGHVNPYTGLAYGQDPQVLYLETMNETSTEYAIIAGNKFQGAGQPAVSYWSHLLQSKWAAYATAHGLEVNDIYTAGTTAQREARSEFLRGLDQAYFTRIKALVRQLGCQAPMAFSNLWRGDAFQKLEESISDVVEEHDYDDPLVPRAANDFLGYLGRSTPVGKPYVIGELNQGQDETSLRNNSPYRTLLVLAASAYGAFNEWSGVTWFAWAHGDEKLGDDGKLRREERRPAVNSDMIGQLGSDGMVLDHMRTAGILFRRGLVAPSVSPVTWFADLPLGGTLGYQDLMGPKYPYKAGWQNLHAIKRAYGPVPPAQLTAPWMTTVPTNPLVSDTKEIRKDTARQQLTVSAPKAEAFGGKLDGNAPAGLTHLGIAGTDGSATVILVAGDDQPLSTSNHLILSRTYLDRSHQELGTMGTTLARIRKPAAGSAWHLKRTRPRGDSGYEVLAMPGEVLSLPSDNWHEAELVYAPAKSLAGRDRE